MTDQPTLPAMAPHLTVPKASTLKRMRERNRQALEFQ
jgi:hypothetical protein